MVGSILEGEGGDQGGEVHGDFLRDRDGVGWGGVQACEGATYTASIQRSELTNPGHNQLSNLKWWVIFCEGVMECV